jgi:hypothetical protein
MTQNADGKENQGAASAGHPARNPDAAVLPPHEPDMCRPGNPAKWCERCRIEAAATAVPAPSPDGSREDTARLDWLERQKWGHGRGGWEVKKPESGWALQIIPRGPWHSLRAAIDAARGAPSSPPPTETPE